MATLLLGIAGSAFGSALSASVGLGTIATTMAVGAGKILGETVGNRIENTLFNKKSIKKYHNGIRLTNTLIQSMSYGDIIPITYGTTKISGNIIWADKVQEHFHSTKKKVKNGKKKIKYIETSYSYTVSLAIGICKGEISSIEKIWANEVEIEIENPNIRIYHGSSNQLPDKLIIAKYGKDFAPAYRDLAYIIFENLDLTSFENRLPNFTFEVKKKIKNNNSLEKKIKGIVIIPGSGEFVYDTNIQISNSIIKSNSRVANYIYNNKNSDKNRYYIGNNKKSINQHNTVDKANAIVALDQLKETLPNIEWVSVVVNWFTDSLNISQAKVYPAVENHSIDTFPDKWNVSGIERFKARIIGNDNGLIRYGGTVNDISLLRYLKELKNRNYKIMLYPMLQVDCPGKPWRGRITGNYNDVKRFFRVNGYNDFIKHYAYLTRELIDSFIIGSEMVNLNKIRDENGIFLAVDEFINLSNDIKKIFTENGNNNIKITYAADWSEYHHTDGGWYHLDKLWSSENIDFIGIDSYFPLTDIYFPDYNISNIKHGWESGEGYEYYYADDNKNDINYDKNIKNNNSNINNLRGDKIPLLKRYAWKNIKWWWNNYHINPDGNCSSWIPRQKKIWFTEYGFPSVDLSTNQPNVFFDSASYESSIPRYSQGKPDIISQRIGIEATENYWRDSSMIEMKMLWCWDARPYPTWPQRSDIWSDNKNWNMGHWVQGKMGITTLSNVIEDICYIAGLDKNDIDTTDLNEVVDGFIINNGYSIQQVIEMLQSVYLFDIVEKMGKIFFLSQKNIHKISSEDLIYNGSDKDNFVITVDQKYNLPNTVVLNYFDRNSSYRVNSHIASYQLTKNRLHCHIDLPITISNQYAKYIANRILTNFWYEKLSYEFALPASYINLQPGDIVIINYSDYDHVIKLTDVDFGQNKILRIKGISSNSDYNRLPDFNSNAEIQCDEISQSIEKIGIEEYSINSMIEIIDVRLPAEFYSLFQKDNKDSQIDYDNNTNFNEKSKLYSQVLIAAYPDRGNHWSGCRITWTDQNNNYETSAEIKKPAITGIILNDLVFNNKNSNNFFLKENFCKIIDYENEIIVAINGDLYSTEIFNLFSRNNYNNYAVIGNEVIAFAKVEHIEENIYSLRYILRGLFGTEEFATSGHKNGTRFVLLDERIVSMSVMPCLTDNYDARITVEPLSDNQDIVIKNTYHIDYKYIDINSLPLTPIDFKFIIKNDISDNIIDNDNITSFENISYSKDIDQDNIKDNNNLYNLYYSWISREYGDFWNNSLKNQYFDINILKNNQNIDNNNMSEYKYHIQNQENYIIKQFNCEIKNILSFLIPYSKIYYYGDYYRKGNIIFYTKAN